MCAIDRDVPLKLDTTALRNGRPAPLQDVVASLGRPLAHLPSHRIRRPRQPSTDHLPRLIRFPYSRHSSYPELCHLLALFRPRDVWPCTVDPQQWLMTGTCLSPTNGLIPVPKDLAMHIFFHFSSPPSDISPRCCNC